MVKMPFNTPPQEVSIFYKIDKVLILGYTNICPDNRGRRGVGTTRGGSLWRGENLVEAGNSTFYKVEWFTEVFP
jgi:hypothetical protein